MMKKTIFSLLCAMCALTSNAQSFTQPSLDRPPFGEGKFYVSAGFTGLDLNYNKAEKWNFDLNAKAGYLFADNWMVTGRGEYNYCQNGAKALLAGAGLRYYIEQNGLFVGADANYVHKWHTLDDFMPSVYVGYAFFLNRTVTVEPELYYNQSFNDKDFSGLGFRIGFGIYFE